MVGPGTPVRVIDDGDLTLYHGDALAVLRQLPAGSVHMCVTSPPFYGLRDYGTGTWEGGDEGCDHDTSNVNRDTTKRDKRNEIRDDAAGIYATASGWSGGGRESKINSNVCGKCGARRVDQQIGLEESPQAWVDALVAVFREVRRVLRADGTLWVEVGDSYAANVGSGRRSSVCDPNHTPNAWAGSTRASGMQMTPLKHPTKPKDLVGAPWLLAFALRADGWYLRSDIIWARPNPMPESVTDRPTKSHSYVFLLSKQARYYFDADAIREEAEYGRRDWNGGVNFKGGDITRGHGRTSVTGSDPSAGRNKRSVWTIPTEPLPDEHYAAYPQALVEPCILAGTSERGVCPDCGAPWVRETESERRTDNGEVITGAFATDAGKSASAGPRPRKFVQTLGWRPSCDHTHTPVPAVVLDPFLGSGTTALVARRLGRKCVGIELSARYCELAARRTQQLSLLA